MTYGVDQCRVCGVPIPDRPSGLKQQKILAKVLSKQRNFRPMSESEWRAAGFRAQPTALQTAVPASGCCVDCGVRLTKAKLSRGPRYAFIGMAIAVFAIVGFMVVTSMLVTSVR